MSAARDHRPIRRLRRLTAACAIPWLLIGVGCATLGDRGHPLVPSRPQARTGPFLLFANFSMADHAPAVRCLQALERDLEQYLGFRPALDDAPIEVYVLDDRNAFTHFLQFYYPELPPRRAFFLARGEDRLVYTYSSPRLEEDLRHEATHALLRGAFGDLPLWLDEGLAEFFESNLAEPDVERTRVDQIAADLRDGWSPNLERLEALRDIHQMTPRDYRESWAWVSQLINGSEPGKSILLAYLGESGRGTARAPLSSRLAPAGITTDRLLADLKDAQARPVAARPVGRQPGEVRLQDRPIEPGPPRPPRGLLRRLRTWLGF